jgi:ChrR Cupin-like domain
MITPEIAEDFVLGALSPIEREAVQLERAVNHELDRAIIALEEKLAPLTASAGNIRPPAHLLDGILARIAEEAAELDDKIVQPFADGDWRPCLPGVEMKRMWSPLTFLLRCQAGAVIPQHVHGQFENMVIIMGDLEVGGRTLSSGDYHASPPQSTHCDTRTRRGCVLLVQYTS